MKIILLSILSAYSFSIVAQTTSAVNMISYKQEIFDSDTCCWRKLSGSKKYAEAAELIIQYLDGSKNIANRHSLNWHTGQLYAMAQQKGQAKKYFRKTYSFLYKLFGENDAKAWYYYAKGTIAFLQRDKQKLQRIIDKWETHYEKDKNYKTLVVLLKKWESTYQEALSN